MINSKLKKINFTNKDKCIGTFTYNTREGIHTDIVALNKKHNNKITSDIIFSNNDFAVEKIISVYDTTTLLSVIYDPGK